MVASTPAASTRSTLPSPAGAPPVLPPADLSSWLSHQSQDPRAVRELALALKKPVEHSLEDLRFRPRRAAELIGPLLEAALVEHDERRLERFKERCWRFMAIVVNPSLWSLSVRALWEGRPVWPFLEQRAGWYQVVESVLIDARTQGLLAKVDAPGRRHRGSDEPLHSLLNGGAAQQGAETSSLLGTDARDSQVLVLVGERCRLAVRVCGLAPDSLRPKLQTLCMAADRLLENPKLDARARLVMIAQLNEKALIKNCPSASPWTRRTALFCTVMALGVFAAACLSVGLEERRWQSTVQAFCDEPGIQVLGESTGWGRHEIVGLRDPMSRAPADILLSQGMSPDRVIARFKPFVSADELMTQLRQSEATRALMTHGAHAPVTSEPTLVKP